MRHTVKEIKLNNGSKGLLVNIPDASVMTFDINFRAGEYLVEEKKYEVPHLMEHVLLGANELIPKARDFQAEIEKNGAYSNAATGVYDITYEAECADFEWDRVLQLFLAAIDRPLFLEEEFKAEFGNVQEEMAARSNNHFRRLSLEMRQKVGLIAKTDLERLELMSNVSVNDVRDHYRKTHITPNMRFIVAGDLTEDRQKQIKDMFEAVHMPKKGKRFDLPHENPKTLKKPVYIKNDTVENIYFYLDTFRLQRFTDPDIDALGLINTMLTETLYSKILGTARERGLVYGMNSGLSETRNACNWWFGAQVSEKNAKALMGIIIKELINVMNGDISVEDIDSAKQYSIGRFQRSAQTVGGTASGYSGRYFFDGKIEPYYDIPVRLKAVKKDKIIEIAKQMFEEKIWGIGILGNCHEQFAEELHRQVSVLWKIAS